MGDRGNVFILERHGRETTGVFLYTHWTGSDLPHIVHAALAKEWRWSDPPYLARIVFDVLTEGQQGQETGFGISAIMSDNEHPVIVLDPTRREMWAAKAGTETQPLGPKLPFKDYVADPQPSWGTLIPGYDEEED